MGHRAGHGDWSNLARTIHLWYPWNCLSDLLVWEGKVINSTLSLNATPCSAGCFQQMTGWGRQTHFMRKLWLLWWWLRLGDCHCTAVLTLSFSSYAGQLRVRLSPLIVSSSSLAFSLVGFSSLNLLHVWSCLLVCFSESLDSDSLQQSLIQSLSVMRLRFLQALAEVLTYDQFLCWRFLSVY